ncbi:MAG: hypothetical protein Q8R61_00245 [Thiobacillus sp.]|uniref:hypothetical protein n=1 Tax=Thiobacillus sp. TaxID=924 RepID=UPI0027340AA4|nr:hypothetical protein [Thiobacillus sp.]MDP3583530.1 hypothetical protein [Thiobacillus sp.]
MSDAPSLSKEEIQAKVHAKLDEYKQLSMLEQYAMFMGKAQILEFGLKGLLTRRYNIPPEDMERWTLGITRNELRDRGLRADFISLLDSLVDYRNNMAHEFLVNNAITRSIADLSQRKLYGDLFRAVYELEQIIILYDWCEENGGW